MTSEYTTTATIDASPDVVWRLLSDAAGYATWNPEIIGVDGNLAAGARVKAHVRLGSGAVRKVPQRVEVFEPPRRMQWVGGLPLGLFVGRAFAAGLKERAEMIARAGISSRQVP